MGAAASSSFPERLNQAECEAMVGVESFDLSRFNQMCDENGLVSKAEVLALGEDDEEDLQQVAATVERNGIFFSFASFDADDSGGLTYEEFAAAAKSLGFLILAEHLEEECRRIDLDNSGVIDQEEFVKFIIERTRKKLDTDPEKKNNKNKDHMHLTYSQSGLIFDYIGSTGAQHGYSTALTILEKRPDAAKDQLPGVGKGTPWLPLHYVLSQESSSQNCDIQAAAARARRIVATPLVLKLIQVYPAAAAQRIMEGLRYPRGHLPLELALVRGWDANVCQALIQAYPQALTLLDPINKKVHKQLQLAGVNPNHFDSTSSNKSILKNFRYMWQIAKKAHCTHEVMALLPKPCYPSENSNKFEWIPGAQLVVESAQKQEKLHEEKQRRLKKQARLQAKRSKEKERRRQKQAENETKMITANAKLQELLRRSESIQETPSQKECASAPSSDHDTIHQTHQLLAEAPVPAPLAEL